MSTPALENLVRIGRLKREPAARGECLGMITAARSRLKDSRNESLDPDSRFDLAYGAAHRLALVALRIRGYRSENRITVFQTLTHTLKTSPADLQTLLRAHNARNLAEYEGSMEIDAALLDALIRCAAVLETEVSHLNLPDGKGT